MGCRLFVVGGRLRAWSRVMRAELVERAKASGL